MFALFLDWGAATDPAACVSESERARLAGLLGGIPGLDHALIHTPTTAHDPYLNDGPSPPLALQLYFADIADLEAASAADGALRALATPDLAGAEVTQQAMLARSYPVDAPAARGAPVCTYLVAYTGQPADLNAWLSYYNAHHPAIMRRFPGIRGIEICTRIDWCGALPFARVAHIQRNKVVFDDPAKLNAALNSPVRDEMRRDFHNFPAYAGGNTHFPMLTQTVVPDGER